MHTFHNQGHVGHEKHVAERPCEVTGASAGGPQSHAQSSLHASASHAFHRYGRMREQSRRTIGELVQTNLHATHLLKRCLA